MKSKIILSLLSLLSIITQGYAIKPKSEYINIPTDFGVTFTEEKVKSTNATLVTWFMVNAKSPTAPTIIMCNSDFGNMSYLLSSATQLYKEGFNIVLFDYRGFGKSSSFKIDSNQLYYDEFCEDLVAVHKYCRSKVKGSIYIYGQSMGTIIATISMSKNKELSNSKFIFESFIESLDNAVSILKNMKNRDFTLPPSHIHYNSYVQTLFNREGLVFVGSEDSISAGGKIDYKQTKWTVVPYEGGHLAASYALEDDFYKKIVKYAL